MIFNTFSLHPAIIRNITTLGYSTPTPIQAQSIPLVMQGKDVMGLAETGTGKTAAYALPIIHNLMQGPRRQLRALIIAPTRELAQQIHDAIVSYTVGTDLRVVTLYGGVSMAPQLQALKDGAEIAVACPGRLLDHINQRTINLSRVAHLVLDEADQMLDMGFLPDVRTIIRFIPKQRQTLLFSATMPEAILGLVQEVLRDPVKVEVARSKPAASVKQVLYPVPKHLKTALLIHLLKQINKESVLIFTRTKHTAKRVAQKLMDAGFSATALQGNMSQNKRQFAMNGFRDGSLQMMVATDIASRGIDVTRISHVINYDIPETVETYIHRIGRTGRAAKEGEAFTLLCEEDQMEINAIERTLGKTIERVTAEHFDYAVPAPERKLGHVATYKPRQNRRGATKERTQSPGR